MGKPHKSMESFVSEKQGRKGQCREKEAKPVLSLVRKSSAVIDCDKGCTSITKNS